MITYRRAIIAALAFLTIFFILHTSHSSPASVTVADSTPQSGAASSPPKEAKQQTTSVASKPGLSKDAGKGTSDLKKKSRSQIPLAELHKKPLREQLEYQFPYDVESKFPAYIWQTWKYTPASGQFNEAFRESEASWTILHPTFVHEVITDDVAVHLIRHLYAAVPQVVEAYNALPVPVLKADFFRYLILLARGGIYSDIDTAALKSAAEWVPETVPRDTYGMVIGIEADPDREDWAQWYSRRIQFCQWTIQAKPGHPILRDVVANITQETLKRKAEGRLTKDTNGIVEFTGPALWTDVVFHFFNDPEYFDMSESKGNITWRDFTGMTKPRKVGDVIVLPITSFSPGVRQMGAGEDDDPMAFVKHRFEGSWKPESERHVGQ